MSTSAVFVDSSVADDLAERVAERMRHLLVGDPADEDTDIGPLTEALRAVRASRLVGDLVASGASCLVGGGPNEGNLVEPTLLAGVEPGNPRYFPQSGSREILAPVLVLCPLEGKLEQSPSWLAPRTQLSVSIFTDDLDRAAMIASSLPVYNVHVNGVPTWRDGLIFDPGSSMRLGRRKSRSRVNDLSTHQDIVFHPLD